MRGSPSGSARGWRPRSASSSTSLDTFAKGPLVVNHRIDRFISTTRPLTWEGVGVFFLKDGKIKEWFDYTIRTIR